MDFDGVLSTYLGEMGRYQAGLVIILSLLSFPTVFNNLDIIFAAAETDFRCAAAPALQQLNISQDLRQNLTSPWMLKDGHFVRDACRTYEVQWDGTEDGSSPTLPADAPIVPCTSWEYDRSVFTETVVTQWDLVCEWQWLVASAQSIYMGGLLVGVFFSGIISDRFGRRPITLTVTALCTLIRIILPFSPNYLTFIALRFVLGSCSMAWYTVSYVLTIELVGPSWRTAASLISQFTWALGFMLMPLYAYFLRHWVTFYLAVLSLFIPSLALFFIVPESPRWLITQGRHDEAILLIRRMARINRRQVPTDLVLTKRDDTDHRRATPLDLVKTANMRKISLILFFNWFVISLCYYGLTLSSPSLGGDIFVNVFISGAVEIPSYTVTLLAIRSRLGRRWTYSGSFALGGVMLLFTLAVPPSSKYGIVTLTMAGKFFVSGCFAVAYTYTVELMPTVVRNVGLGTSSMMARAGGILAPFVAMMSTFGQSVPIIIFGVLAILAGGLAIMLPETRNIVLPDNIADTDKLFRKSKSEDDLTKSQNGLSNLGMSMDSISSKTKSMSSISSISLYYESYV